MARATGIYAISSTLGEPVQAFVPPQLEWVSTLLEDLGIVIELIGQKNRRYSYARYISMLAK